MASFLISILLEKKYRMVWEDGSVLKHLLAANPHDYLQ